MWNGAGRDTTWPKCSGTSHARQRREPDPGRAERGGDTRGQEQAGGEDEDGVVLQWAGLRR